MKVKRLCNNLFRQYVELAIDLELGGFNKQVLGGKKRTGKNCLARKYLLKDSEIYKMLVSILMAQEKYLSSKRVKIQAGIGEKKSKRYISKAQERLRDMFQKRQDLCGQDGMQSAAVVHREIGVGYSPIK